MVITYFFRRILMFFAVLFICPFVAYGAETCSAGQMMVDGACVEPEFTITTTDMAAESTFSFKIYASGTFYVDFDDGRGVQKIVRTDTTTNPTYTSAAYANAGTHIIKMYGGATGYSTSYYIAAISFANNTNIKSVDGSMGKIFGGSAEYMFYRTFYGCTSLTSIPDTLFEGVTDSAESMFHGTFAYCTSLQSIPDNLFEGVRGSAESMFEGTFYGCTSLPSIPDTLFSGVSGSAWSMFDSTFAYCTSLPSIPDTLFEGVRGSANGMFYGTFEGCTLLKSIPGTLFRGVTGSASEMFLRTFRDCTSLQSIPDNLFEGVTGSASRMFDSTFFGCTSLKSLPKGLFKNIEGRPATSAFNYTFYGCSNLSGYIPSDMFENMDSTDYTSGPMTDIFTGTNLDTVCPAGTYQYITGFESDWSGKVSCGTCPDGMIAIDGVCTKVDCTENQDGACLEPEFTITTTDMAAGTVFEFSISAAGTYYIDWGDDSDIEIIEKTDTTNTPYSHTYADGGVHTIGMGGDATKYASFRSAISFSGNKNIAALGGSLGEIFDGSARRMFYQTFMDCTSLQSIPESLFSGVTVTNPQIFYSTFKGCTSLESLPSGLFKNITNDGSLGINMFGETFAGCSKLSGYIPSDMFAGLDVTNYTSGPMTDIFAGTNLDTVCPAGTYQYITGFESDWSGKVSCGTCPEGSTIAASGTSCICNNGDAFVDGACVEPEFTITTTDMAEYTKFTMTISAAGTYYIDWGDGTSQVIKKTNTKGTEYNHIYEKAGVYTIKMAGDATEYGTTVAINFLNNTNIAALGGSLGAIFGGSTKNMFSAVFYGCTSLKSIPETLFSGISGSATGMFYMTFVGCTSLQEIPENLFSGVTDSADSMFNYTFGNCTSLKSLPKGLFKNIEGRPATSAFNGTFYGCSNLSGYIPSDMFENLDSTDYTSGPMTDIFTGTNLDTVCPAGTYQYITGFESDWSGKVSCSTCPGGYTSDVGATAENMCYKTCSIPCTQQPCPENSINCENVISSTSGKQYYGGTCDVVATTCKITFDCASGYYMNNGMCAPCPDGICSINKPCSPTANATGETTCQYNANTGDYSDCNECRFVSCNDGYQYINGECKIVVTCNPGQYLPAGASECAQCPAGSYCIGNETYVYNPNYAQGISGNCYSGSYSPAGATECTECPVPDKFYKGIPAGWASNDYATSLVQCGLMYGFMPEYMLEGLFGMTVQEAIDTYGYDPDSEANQKGLLEVICFYDQETGQYTKDCMGVIAACEGGYYTNGEINEEFVGLPFPYLEASTLEEMLNTYCVPAEPGYWSPGLPHTAFENINVEELSLTWVRNACPAGTTSAAGASDISHCVGGRTLHIGDDITMNLTTSRPTTPRVMVFQVLDELYYGGLSDTEKTINKNTDKKFRIFFDNKDYWLHDYTVE